MVVFFVRLKKTQKSDHELARYYKAKEQNTSALLQETDVSELKSLKAENISLKQENEQLQEENDQHHQRLEGALQENNILQDRLDDIEEEQATEIDFRTDANGRPYSDAFRSCVWDLLGMNLAEHNIVSAIDSVLKLVGKSMKNRPALNTISELSKGRLSASQQQLQVSDSHLCFWCQKRTN